MIDKEKVKQAVRLLIEAFGEDPEREGLIDTPARAAALYEEVLKGYADSAARHLKKTFECGGNELVLERNIKFYSLCEHHLLPFFGKVHIAYIPDGRVVGLSKLARTVEVFARRLQLQERMTKQIAEAVFSELKPRGVLVVVEAEHLCISMRGVKKSESRTFSAASAGEVPDSVKAFVLGKIKAV
jgi:GTP cyclohydrolase I